MLDSSHGAVVVVDGQGAYLGAVDFATVAQAIQAMRREARDQLRAEAVELSDTGGIAAS